MGESAMKYSDTDTMLVDCMIAFGVGVALYGFLKYMEIFA
jgi:hypothetical protein